MMNIKVKWYWLISVVMVLNLTCKVPDPPYLSIDDITIINKGRYIYKIEAGDPSFVWSYDTLVLEIENVHFAGDTTMFVGNMYVMNDKMFDGSQRLFPLIIYKTKEYLTIKCKQDYFSEEHRFLSNISLQFPFTEDFGYLVDDGGYRISYTDNYSKYEFNGCTKTDGWLCILGIKEKLDNTQLVYNSTIRFTPNFFIQSVHQNMRNKNGYWEYVNLTLIRIEQ